MMSEGAGATYYFHYMPNPGRMAGFGNFLGIDNDYKILTYPPQYLATQIITKEWVQPVDAPHRLLKPPATSTMPPEMCWSPPMPSSDRTANGQ